MSKWKFTLPNSKDFRRAVADEAYETVLNEIIKGYGHIQTRTGEDMSSEIKSVEEDIEFQAFDEDSVNYHLENFYTDCDIRGVWIEIC